MDDFIYANTRKISRRIKPYLYDDRYNKWFGYIEDVTNFRRENIALYILAVLLFDLEFGWKKRFLCNLIGFLYPAYASLMTGDTSAIFGDTKWTLYWIIYVSLDFLESMILTTDHSLRLYWVIKCIFLIWLMLPGENGGTSIIHCFLVRWLDIASTAGIKTNPHCNTIEFRGGIYGTKNEDIYIQSNRQGIINLQNLPDNDYAFDAFCTLTEPPLLLCHCRIKKYNRVVDQHIIDLQATLLHATFKNAGILYANADISGNFIDSRGYSYVIKGKTDSLGVFKIVLPEGVIDNFVATKSGDSVKKQGKLFISPPVPTPLNIQRPPRYVTIDINSTSFSDTINPTNVNAKVVILGDVSGSMVEGTRMNVLKRSFKDIFHNAQKKDWDISLASWNQSIEWCSQKWIRPSETNVVEKWIDNRSPNGGNDMKRAIEECMKHFSDATDVYVMCDGDITPFTFDENSNNWSHSRSKYPKTKFHFIALGKDVACENLERMATIGGGGFTHST